MTPTAITSERTAAPALSLDAACSEHELSVRESALLLIGASLAGDLDAKKLLLRHFNAVPHDLRYLVCLVSETASRRLQ